MKKLYILLFTILMTSLSFGQTLLAEDFDYGSTAGNLATVSSGSWVNHSGTVAVGYATTSLSMTNYPSSGTAGSATIIATGSEDINRSFTSISSGSIYFSALVNISAVTATGAYFFHLKDGTATGFRARIGAKDDGSGKILFGITTSSGTPIYGTTPFDLNTTYLLVGSFNVTTGESKLYVLTAHQATEPVTPEATDTSTNALSISSIAFRQATNIPTAIIDGVRVGTTWNNTVVTTVLSTKNNQIENFNMYPNPTSLGYVTLTSKSTVNMNVSVFDVLGKQVLNQTVSNKRLNVTGLKSGIYLLKATQDNATTTKKLVIK